MLLVTTGRFLNSRHDYISTSAERFSFMNHSNEAETSYLEVLHSIIIAVINGLSIVWNVSSIIKTFTSGLDIPMNWNCGFEEIEQCQTHTFICTIWVDTPMRARKNAVNSTGRIVRITRRFSDRYKEIQQKLSCVCWKPDMKRIARG